MVKRVDHLQAGLDPAFLRALLRRLRDLNLRAARIAVGAGARVSLAGCSTCDGPVESGVVYRLSDPEGRTGRLRLSAEGSDLVARLEWGTQLAAVRTRFGLDARGRVFSRELRLRVDLTGGASRDLERLLRRVLRSLFAPPSDTRL
jgi:hypothetical protein